MRFGLSGLGVSLYEGEAKAANKSLIKAGPDSKL